MNGKKIIGIIICMLFIVSGLGNIFGNALKTKVKDNYSKDIINYSTNINSDTETFYST